MINFEVKPIFKIVPKVPGAEIDAQELRDILGKFDTSSSMDGTVSIEDDIKLVGDASYLFSGFGNVSGVEHLDTSQVTNMNSMFAGCIHAHDLDVSGFDTSNVTDMAHMFEICGSLDTLDVSNFDTSKVVDMSEMFRGCQNVDTLDLSGFDTSNVVNMNGMFSDCYNLSDLNVSSFDTSAVKNMGHMFEACRSLSDIDVSNFDTSSVSNMDSMFAFSNVEFLDLSYLDVSSVENMERMFGCCTELKDLDVSGWDVSNVTDMSKIFSVCLSLESLSLCDWNISDSAVTSDMFNMCQRLDDVNATGMSLADVERCKFPSGTYLDCEMLAKNGAVLPVCVEYGGNDGWQVSWADGAGYKGGSVNMTRQDIENRIQAVEDVKSRVITSSKDTSLTADGQVLGDSTELSKNHGDFGE